MDKIRRLGDTATNGLCKTPIFSAMDRRCRSLNCQFQFTILLNTRIVHWTSTETLNWGLHSARPKKGVCFTEKKNPIYIQVLEHFWLSIKKNPLVKSNFKSPLNSLWLVKDVGMELSHIEKKYVAIILLWVWIFKKWR